MPLTIEEIRQGITETPELKTALLAELESDAVEHIKTKGRIVRTPEEEETFLKSYETQKIDPRIKKIYDDFDRDIEEATGLKKPDGVKTYQHLKTVLSDLSAKGQRAKDLEAEIEKLKEGKVDDLTAKQLKQLQETIAAKEQELKTLQDQSKSQVFEMKNEFAVEKSISGFKIFVPSHVPENEQAAYEASRVAFIKSDFKARFKAELTEKGETVYKDSEGNILMNSSTAAPKTAAEIIEETYKFEFDQESINRKGAGASGKGNSREPGLADVKDKQGIYDYAAKKGLVLGSPEWTKEVEELSKKLNIPIA